MGQLYKQVSLLLDPLIFTSHLENHWVISPLVLFNTVVLM
jgi:hypothetical protein